MVFSLATYLKKKRVVVEKSLREVFSEPRGCPPLLWKSMKYSVFAGGKRLRPVLCLAAAEVVGLPEKAALRIACALELIHTYSLIHDDLPALDNDDFRRGRKTNHKIFGEAMAILAGDGLLTLAFEWVSDAEAYPKRFQRNVPAICHELARHAGYAGMVGGQVDDVLSEGRKPLFSKVLSIHRRKTGALLLSSVCLPGLLAGVDPKRLKALTDYGRFAGLAFQIVDDILNEMGNSNELGKTVGSDKQRGKMTYPAVAGIEGSQKTVRRLTRKAVSSINVFGDKSGPLVTLAEFMAERTN